MLALVLAFAGPARSQEAAKDAEAPSAPTLKSIDDEFAKGVADLGR